MFPLDFEEFLYANGINEVAISAIQKKFARLEALDEPMHNKLLDLFRKYLLVGGLPDAVNVYLAEKMSSRSEKSKAKFTIIMPPTPLSITRKKVENTSYLRPDPL